MSLKRALPLVRLAGRIVLVWAIESAALWLLARLLPGLWLDSWQTAVLGIAVIGILNALVRPLLLWIIMPVVVFTLGLFTLLLNALVLMVAAGWLVPGLHVADWQTAVLTILGVAAINTITTTLVSRNDRYSFYYYLIRHLARRSAPPEVDGKPGLLMIEIDGLATPVLRQAIEDGLMPTLAHWLQTGSHRLMSWDCGLPSQTSASQSGILFGNNFDIPAFRWYEKEHERLLISNHPGDAAEIERRVSTEKGLLHRCGFSLGNLVSGGAPESMLTMSTLTVRNAHQSAGSVYLYFLNPYNFTRLLVLLIWEILVELWQGARQRLRNVQPRVSRGRSFPLLRAISTVLLRDLSVYFLIHELFGGIEVVYATFVGYDVVAHHAGPTRRDALQILRDLDSRLDLLAQTAREAPRPYHFVILSDHGQSQGTPFRQRYGQSLEELVRALLHGEQEVQGTTGEGEGWGHLSALLSEAVQVEQLAGKATRRILQPRTRDGYVEVGPERKRPSATKAKVVVCASGNLGLIYFTAWPHRLSLEEIASYYPGLIEGLVGHEGIGFLLLRSQQHGPLVLGKKGICFLEDGRVSGTPPLTPFGPAATRHLQRLDTFPHTGDIVVNSRYDPATGEVAAFEELIGSHGGLGGPQTEPFLMFPAAWEIESNPLVGPITVHDHLQRWRHRLLEKN